MCPTACVCVWVCVCTRARVREYGCVRVFMRVCVCVFWRYATLFNTRIKVRDTNYVYDPISPLSFSLTFSFGFFFFPNTLTFFSSPFSMLLHVLFLFFQFLLFSTYFLFTLSRSPHGVVAKELVVGWLVGWLVGFYGISTFLGYLTPNPFLCK